MNQPHISEAVLGLIHADKKGESDEEKDWEKGRKMVGVSVLLIKIKNTNLHYLSWAKPIVSSRSTYAARDRDFNS